MICKVISAIEKYNMPVEGKTIVVGVSGGADSMCLLDVLRTLQPRYTYNLIVCHINHCIRGEQADSDEEFVENYCAENDIPFRSAKIDVPNLAKKFGMSEEAYGRKARYEFFNSMGDDVVIATAHTLSDRCETLLFNITRGTSTSGLSSIPAVRGNIIRPLITCTRSEIENYCKEKSINFVTDKTNYIDIYSRNRIRLNVIPQLRKINPALENSIERLIDSAENDSDYFDEILSKIITKSKTDCGYKTDFFKNQHSAVRLRVIAEILKFETGIYPETVHIKSVDSILNGGKVEIIGGNFISVKDGILKVNEKEQVPIEEWQCDFSTLEAVTPNGKIYAEIFNKKELSKSQFVHNKVLDYDKLQGALTVRNRRAGDTFKVAGSSCTKKLKNLFTERKTENRNNIPIITDEIGIVWIWGIGCSDRCKITDKTKTVMFISEGYSNDRKGY